LTNLTPNLPLDLSEEAFKSWLEHPGTLALKRYLHAWREEEKERWATGDLETSDPVATAIKNAAVIGQCKLCDKLMSLEYEDLRNDGSEEGN
jgi:hypothetical protein